MSGMGIDDFVGHLGDTCPGCGHKMDQHAQEVGCMTGWPHKDPLRPGQGCPCGLTLATTFRPPTERSFR